MARAWRSSAEWDVCPGSWNGSVAEGRGRVEGVGGGGSFGRREIGAGSEDERRVERSWRESLVMVLRSLASEEVKSRAERTSGFEMVIVELM